MYYVAVEARVHKMLRSGGGGRFRPFQPPTGSGETYIEWPSFPGILTPRRT